MAGWQDIIGHAGAMADLKRMHGGARMPHALIFAGPAGIGKYAVARALATLFLCRAPAAGDPCGTCDSCRLMVSGNHPDFHRVHRLLIRSIDKDRKGRDLSIEVAREFLLRPALRTSQMNAGKAIIVDEAETMNTEAQNACLKVIEEPIGKTLIILIVESETQLLQTIRSRCQVVRLGRLTDDECRAVLLKGGMADAECNAVVPLVRGSPGLGLHLKQLGFVSASAEFAARLTRLMTAGAPVADLAAWLKQQVEAYAKTAQDQDDMLAKDIALRQGLSLLLGVAGQTASRSLKSGTEDAHRLERICQSVDIIQKCHTAVEGNVNLQLALGDFVSSLEQIWTTPQSA
jgi:DNA polymerase III subunit delta'